jgi:catechol 2,3-dioxygenase-like lactoylglutathione lyase family enzyme
MNCSRRRFGVYGSFGDSHRRVAATIALNDRLVDTIATATAAVRSREPGDQPNGGFVARLDHLAVSVSDLAITRDWYTSVLGLEVEFDTGTAAGLKDEGNFTLILTESHEPVSLCNLFFRVDDVEAAYKEMCARHIPFRYPPQSNDWGYGAGLTDPDGRLVALWDETSMRTHEAE